MKFTNRKIKFRVWTGATMEYRVLAGALGHFYVEGMSDKDSACLSDANTIYSDGTPLMQWTGLMDKNGTEIYEGDIVIRKNSGILYEGFPNESEVFLEVKFGEIKYSQFSGFYFSPIKYKVHTMCGYTTDEKEEFFIIGNIFQNPGLLNTP